MSPKLKKGIRWAISAAILVFLILFARTIDWHAAWNSMRHASLPLLAAAIGVNILSVLIKARALVALPPPHRNQVAAAWPFGRPLPERD